MSTIVGARAAPHNKTTTFHVTGSVLVPLVWRAVVAITLNECGWPVVAGQPYARDTLCVIRWTMPYQARKRIKAILTARWASWPELAPLLTHLTITNAVAESPLCAYDTWTWPTAPLGPATAPPRAPRRDTRPKAWHRRIFVTHPIPHCPTIRLANGYLCYTPAGYAPAWIVPRLTTKVVVDPDWIASLTHV